MQHESICCLIAVGRRLARSCVSRRVSIASSLDKLLISFNSPKVVRIGGLIVFREQVLQPMSLPQVCQRFEKTGFAKMHLILRTIVLRTIPPARCQRAELLRTNGGCRATATDIAEKPTA